MSTLLKAAELLTRRLRVLQRLQLQARERGETHLELHVEELFDAADAEAIEDWEKALAEHHGAQVLPFPKVS